MNGDDFGFVRRDGEPILAALLVPQEEVDRNALMGVLDHMAVRHDEVLAVLLDQEARTRAGLHGLHDRHGGGQTLEQLL